VSTHSFPKLCREDDTPNAPRALPRWPVSAEHALGNLRLCCGPYGRSDKESMPLECGLRR
jgi:hypothetical protein